MEYEVKQVFDLMEMLWESLFGSLFKNVKFKPRFQKSPAIRKHLNISGNDGHGCNTHIFGFVQSM